MSWWTKAIARFGMKAAALDPDFNSALKELIGYPESRTGVTVTWRTALQATTILRGTTALANSVAMVPLKLYRPRADGRGSDEATDHPLYWLLYRKPNPWQTSFAFRHTMVMHLVLAHRFVAFKNIVGNIVGGEIRELIPFRPDQVEIVRNRDLSLRFFVTADDGARREFPAAAIWYIPGPSWDTWSGLDAVKLAREAIGLSLATERSHAEFHKNSTRVSGTYAVDSNMSPAKFAELAAWIDQHALGGPRAGKPLIMDLGAKWQSMQMSGVDAQHIELRNFQVEEGCRIIGVFPQMVGHSGNSAPTFASAEQFFGAHVVHSVGPYYSMIEQSIETDLIGATKPGEVFARFTANALLRGAMKDEAEYFARARGPGGWLTANDVRNLKDMNPLPGGDELPPNSQGKPIQPPKDPPQE